MNQLRIKYKTFEIGNIDIHIRMLRDTCQFQDRDGIAEKVGISSATWPIFGVIWPAGEILANHMLNYDVQGKRILEVGCGIALSSLLLNHRCADISATDYHPEVGNFLAENVKLNTGKTIPFTRLDWTENTGDIGTFDMIIGSDIIYEQAHAKNLSNFINNHANQQCEVVIVDPGRGHHARFSKKMVHLGYSHDQKKPEQTDYLKKPFKGQILSYNR